MAALISYNAFVTVNAVNLSSRVHMTRFDTNTDMLDATASGDLAHVMIPGFDVASLQVSFRQDYAAGLVWVTLDPLANTTFVVLYRYNGTAAISPTNPQATFTAMMEGWDPVAGQVGQIMEAPITFSLASGNVVWAEA